MTTRVLADQFGADAGAALWLRRFAMIVLGVALLWLSAKVKVMTEPVPVTLQTLAIMALAMAYGAVNALNEDGTLDRAHWAELREEFETHVVED